MPASGPVYVIRVNSSINPGTGAYMIESVKKANADNAGMLVIELDTPGGLLQTTRLVVQEILSSKVPVAVNVTPRGAHAGSAGVMITMAAHLAVMAPGTNIGAAHPVGIQGVGGGKSQDKDTENVMEVKALNDTVAFVKGIARTRGRNEKWAMDAVRKSSSITADEAVKMNVIDFIAENTDELIRKAEGFGVKDVTSVERLPMKFKLKFLSYIADPNIAYILMLLAALGIYLELSHPGLVLPGVVGAISALLTMMSFQMLPVTVTGVALMIVGFVLIAVEFFVPGLGIFGIGGTVSLVLGGIFLIDPVRTDISVSYSVVVTFGVVFGLTVFLVAYFVLRSRKQRNKTGIEAMYGHTAVVFEYDAGSGAGKLKIRGEIWDFIAGESNFNAGSGDEIVITGSRDLKFIVKNKTK
ncbi:MAG: nodulation protein NfeD [Oligoflexia bacterium]|nr:nodulation protein NfeD [Oligoflexia bacterium]